MAQKTKHTCGLVLQIGKACDHGTSEHGRNPGKFEDELGKDANEGRIPYGDGVVK
jgi:hypothetical protein